MVGGYPRDRDESRRLSLHTGGIVSDAEVVRVLVLIVCGVALDWSRRLWRYHVNVVISVEILFVFLVPWRICLKMRMFTSTSGTSGNRFIIDVISFLGGWCRFGLPFEGRTSGLRECLPHVLHGTEAGGPSALHQIMWNGSSVPEGLWNEKEQECEAKSDDNCDNPEHPVLT